MKKGRPSRKSLAARKRWAKHKKKQVGNQIKIDGTSVD